MFRLTASSVFPLGLCIRLLRDLSAWDHRKGRPINNGHVRRARWEPHIRRSVDTWGHLYLQLISGLPHKLHMLKSSFPMSCATGFHAASHMHHHEICRVSGAFEQTMHSSPFYFHNRKIFTCFMCMRQTVKSIGTGSEYSDPMERYGSQLFQFIGPFKSTRASLNKQNVELSERITMMV